MPPQEVNQILAEKSARVNSYLASAPWLKGNAPERLLEAMQYSLYAGGKRIRPVLCMACAELCDLDSEKALPFAAAIEMIHTYSLIHDDLPAMDDDDLRRGQPSCHRKFDEATAILAGDALLTDAFVLIGKTELPAKAVLAATCELALGAGSVGMAGGQMLDMEYTGLSNVGLEAIAQMQAMKTGALLTASCVCGGLLAEAPGAFLRRIYEYGSALGKAFQITDDILDLTGDEAELGKPVGSDADARKNTYPSLAGIEESKRLAREEARKAIEALPDHPESAFLAGLAEFVVTRRK